MTCFIAKSKALISASVEECDIVVYLTDLAHIVPELRFKKKQYANLDLLSFT
jgi:hypothetical protein